ncbi:MAG: hypothetical protein HY334_02700 [Armatimonadetes bacterium]|nr:hypothetical protein [Armatimonadota bacterium]
METLTGIIRVVHVLTAVLMAWPFYALVAVNNRGRLGPPLGDRTDTYMENIIKNRTTPCFIFQGTALVTGLALILLRGMGLGVLITNAALGFKFLLLMLIAAVLTYVHVSLQPAIDRLFATVSGNPISQEVAAQIQTLRLRRKRLAAVCLFAVLTMVMLGVQVWAAFPVWLTVVLAAAIAAFTWRAYASLTPYGWA